MHTVLYMHGFTCYENKIGFFNIQHGYKAAMLALITSMTPDESAKKLHGYPLMWFLDRLGSDHKIDDTKGNNILIFVFWDIQNRSYHKKVNIYFYCNFHLKVKLNP